MIGKTLGSCEILEKLGQGGMGEVWRARDLKLGREVALKLLSPEFAGDPERIARFDREARTLASLHHQNIATLFGFEESDGYSYLLMELVEGEDLAQRIDRGAMSADEVASIAIQIATGLEAAHEKGIVHRDLKPSNVRITPTGEVKILDFGLARAFTGEPAAETNPSLSPTITAAMTQQGVILGTAAYMSPEQARGQTVDARADIWAFGVMMWEMLHGRRLFAGNTMGDTLANVLKHEIEFPDAPGSAPRSMQRILRRCLVRDPRLRLHSIADARIELVSPSVEGETVGAGSRRLPWLLVALLGISVLVLIALDQDPGEQRNSSASVSVMMPRDAPVMLGDWPALAAAPDGSSLVITATVDGQSTILIRRMDEREFRALSREGDALGPFFSPDSRWVGFFQGGKIRKVSVDGGSPVDLADMSHPRGMSWSDDGYIYYAPSYATGLKRILGSGSGGAETVTQIDSTSIERTHRWPNALPDGRGVVFTSEGSDSPGDYEDADILVWDARNGEVRPLGVHGARAIYSRSGHLLVARRGTLYAYPFDSESAEVTGGPTPVFDDVAGDTASGLYSFELNDRGDLFYLAARIGEAQRSLVWIDRSGAVEPLNIPPGPYRYPQLNRANDKVALVLGEGHGGNDDVYILDLRSEDLTRFSFDRVSIMPRWDPAGDHLYYLSVADGGNVLRRIADGSQPAHIAFDNPGINILGSIAADGSRMFFTRLGGDRLGAITTAELRDGGQIEMVIDSPAAEWAPMISPDQRWLAYVSDETGREEVYVQPWPLTGAKWQVSVEGGRAPTWSPSGDELFFARYDQLYAVQLDTRAGFRSSRPELLFTHPMDNSGIPMCNFDVSTDGQRFLIVEPDLGRNSAAVHVELNWVRALQPVRAN